MSTQKIDTAVVGGGQAGLAISCYLKPEGREHTSCWNVPHPSPLRIGS